MIVTADEFLRDRAQRACAAAGFRPEVVSSAVEARGRWRSAAAVIVGSDAAGRCVELGVPRRPGVLLVGCGEPAWQLGVAVGAADVFTEVDEERLVEAIGRAADGGRDACVVSVVGGTGGSWASTFAAGLGLAGARRGLRSVLLDVDPLGGGADLVLGAEQAEGLRWPQIDPTGGRLAASSFAEVLPSAAGLAALSWTRQVADEQPVGPVLSAVAGDFDLVAADVPRRMGGAAVEVLARSVLTVVTVPCDVRSIAAARLVIAELSGVVGAVVAVAAGRPGGIHPRALGDLLDIPVVGQLRHDRRLRSAIGLGHGPGRSRTLRRAAEGVLDLVGLDSA